MDHNIEWTSRMRLAHRVELDHTPRACSPVLVFAFVHLSSCPHSTVLTRSVSLVGELKQMVAMGKKRKVSCWVAAKRQKYGSAICTQSSLTLSIRSNWGCSSGVKPYGQWLSGATSLRKGNRERANRAFSSISVVAFALHSATWTPLHLDRSTSVAGELSKTTGTAKNEERKFIGSGSDENKVMRYIR